MSYAILAVILVIMDQLTKYAVRAGIPLGGTKPFIPGILDLTYVQNTGAAFSILRVTDMLKTTFIDFPVFNVADCCITVGVPLLFLYVLLYVGRDEKKEDKADESTQLPSDGH